MSIAAVASSRRGSYLARAAHNAVPAARRLSQPFLVDSLAPHTPGLGRILALPSPRPEAQRRPLDEKRFQAHDVAAGPRDRRVGRLPGVLSRKGTALCAHRLEYQPARLAGR